MPALKLVLGLFKHIIGSLFSVFILASIVFFLVHWLPGDPVLLIAGDTSSPEERAALTRLLHTDWPMAKQYAAFAIELFRLHFGPSLRFSDREAMSIVVEALPSSIALAACSITLSATFGVSAAMFAAFAPTSLAGRFCRGYLRVTLALPLLAVAPAATWLFAVYLKWVPLPADPDSGVFGLIYASILLALPLSAPVGRIARASLEGVASAPFLVVARAKGLSPLAVWMHALAAGAAPIIVTICTQFGALLGGALVLEKLLERRGLGMVLTSALQFRDIPVIMASVVVGALMFVTVIEFGWLVERWLDPRGRS